jgi:hypothetical protein
LWWLWSGCRDDSDRVEVGIGVDILVKLVDQLLGRREWCLVLAVILD